MNVRNPHPTLTTGSGATLLSERNGTSQVVKDSGGHIHTGWKYEKTKPYSMVGIAGQIQCPCLVMEAEGDMFLPGQPQKIYDALKAPKQLVKFTSEDGAENHCQSGALAYLHEVVFNWLDETLKLHDDRNRTSPPD
jgi:hypothetical protein